MIGEILYGRAGIATGLHHIPGILLSVLVLSALLKASTALLSKSVELHMWRSQEGFPWVKENRYPHQSDYTAEMLG